MILGEPSARRLRASLSISRPLPALLVLLLVCGAIAAGVATSFESHPAGAKTRIADPDLYRMVIDDVRRGTPYYQAATQEQRRYHYPLHPFIAVRPPVLAVSMAVLPNLVARQWALRALALVTFAVWWRRLVKAGLGKLDQALALTLLGTGLSLSLANTAYTFHEFWAGLLIALSLALRKPERWGLSLLIGLLAALTRELAAAYLVAMAVLAWRDGCRREAVGWTAALGVVALALFAHAGAVHAQLQPGDPVSQGWFKVSGWPFVLSTVQWNIFLIGEPRWIAAALAPLALLGLAAWRDPLGERVALIVFGYACAFFVIGRPENHYWGLLIAPLWPLGLLLAPQALMDLWRTLGLRKLAASLGSS